MFPDKSCRENQNTHFVTNNFLFLKWCPLLNSVEIYCRAGQATDDNMEHVHCLLDTSGYKCILRISNAYWYPLQQWLHERPSMLRYTYIAYLVKKNVDRYYFTSRWFLFHILKSTIKMRIFDGNFGMIRAKRLTIIRNSPRVYSFL
jgi:hypothetical protein